MKKLLLIVISLSELPACQYKSASSAHWQPDTTIFSQYSFVNDTGLFIDNHWIRRMYDATNNLGAYRIDSTRPAGTSGTETYDKTKIVSELFKELLSEDSTLCKSLLMGHISALDTTDKTQHGLHTFIPKVYDELSKKVVN